MAFDFKNASDEDRKLEYNRIAREIGDDQFFTKKELNHLPEVLADGEQVLAFASGLMDSNTWLITLTDRRIIFLDKGMIFGLKQTSIELGKVNSVSGKTGILFGKIMIEDGAAQRVIDNVPKKTVIPFVNKVRDALHAKSERMISSHPSKSQQSAITEDPVDRLEKLQKMKDKGLITDLEFSEQKNRILNSI